MFLKVFVMLFFLFPIQNLFAQDIDKSLYQKIAISEINWDTKGTEHYKFDVVFVKRRPHENAGKGNEFFEFFEFDGDSSYDRGGIFPGPNTLPEIKPGRFVTVYHRLFPSTQSNETTLDVIDHIEIPVEDFSFTATHKTKNETAILFAPEYNTLLTIDSGVEVQVLGPESYDRKMKDGDSIWVWLVTGDGFGGWVYSPNLGPLQPATAVESPPSVVFNEPEPALEPETERVSGFPLPWTIVGLCAALLVVIVAAKRKKK